MNMNVVSRRDFLRMAGYGAAGAAFANAVDTFTLTSALAQGTGGDYKALVCVFLNGGNDGNNTIIPNADLAAGVSYTAYNNERRASGLYVPQPGETPIAGGNDPGIPISPSNTGFGTNSFILHNRLGRANTFTRVAGFPISVAGFGSRFNAGNAAVVCNVGTLVQYMGRTQYQSSANPRPAQLFSHSDQIQQNQTCRYQSQDGTGWGGRTGDRTIALNARTGDPAGTRFPMITSISGSPIFGVGSTPALRPLAIAAAPTGLNAVLVLNGYGTAADEVARRTAFNNIRAVDRGYHVVRSHQDVMQQALDVSAALASANVRIPFDTAIPENATFPNTSIGNQLLQVAKVIKANKTQAALGLRRQIFFVSIGGFDTHQNEIAGQNNLWDQLNNAIDAFFNWTANGEPAAPTGIGNISSEVTLFTLTDFNRTFNPSGTGTGIVGTDHAWGNHHLVIGGAVVGGAFYGKPLGAFTGGTGQTTSNGTVFPSLVKGSVYDTDSRGRWIPTCSLDAYAATLASWFGVPTSELPMVFPHLNALGGAGERLGFLPTPA